MGGRCRAHARSSDHNELDFYLCPATEAQQRLHAWRDTELVRGNALDGACYDISSGNPYRLSRCLRTEHGHSPGRGRTIIEAYDRVNRLSKQAVAKATGRHRAGVETIIENVGGSVDFYVSRACSGPLGVHEAWTSGRRIPRRGRELIPLYQAVYHDVGPVHEDGWLTLPSMPVIFLLGCGADRPAVGWALRALDMRRGRASVLLASQAPAEGITWDGAHVSSTTCRRPTAARSSSFVSWPPRD